MLLVACVSDRESDARSRFRRFRCAGSTNRHAARHRAGARRWRGDRQQMKAPWSLIWAPRGACPLELRKRGQQTFHPESVHVDELPRQQRAAVLRRDGGGQDDHGLITNDSKKTNKVGGGVCCLSPARNPLAYHSDYFGACAVEANGAPRPFCAAARPMRTPRGQAPRGGGVSRARCEAVHWTARKKAQQARQLRTSALLGNASFARQEPAGAASVFTGR